MKLSEHIRLAKASAHVYQDYVDAFSRHYRAIQYREESDYRREIQQHGAGRYSPQTVLSRGLGYLFECEAKAFADAIGVTCWDWRYRMTTRLIPALDAPTKRVSVVSPSSIWYRERKQDIVTNYLLAEWQAQLNGPNPIQTYAVYCTYVCAKSVIKILTEYPNGIETLKNFCPQIPDKQQTLQFLHDPTCRLENVDWFFEHAFAALPGLLSATESVMIRYGDVIRMHRILNGNDPYDEESLLPDDPLGVTVTERFDVPEEDRFEQASQDYLAEDGHADEIARRYRIGQKRFRQYLRKQGLMKQHGGDRRG